MIKDPRLAQQRIQQTFQAHFDEEEKSQDEEYDIGLDAEQDGDLKLLNHNPFAVVGSRGNSSEANSQASDSPRALSAQIQPESGIGQHLMKSNPAGTIRNQPAASGIGLMGLIVSNLADS